MKFSLLTAWLLLVFGVAGLLLLAPLPAEARFVRALIDMGHAPLFATLAVIVLLACRQLAGRHFYRWAVIAWGLLIAFGWASEVAQGYTGRGPSLQDALANTVGASAGVLWYLSRQSTWRWLGLALAGALLLVGEAYPLSNFGDTLWQYYQMPVIATFESPTELFRWQSNRSTIGRVREHATEGTWALRIDLEPSQHPGAAMDSPPANWSGYEELLVDLFLADGPPVTLVVKVEDRWHNHDPSDRFERRFKLGPGPQTLRFSLADIAAAPADRELDLQNVSFVQFYVVQLTEPRTLYLDHIRLQ